MIRISKVAKENLSVWKKLGNDIKGVRKWKGFTDIQVAKRLGIDIKKYRKIERGQTENMTFSEIVNFIKLFDIFPEEILPTDHINM